MKESISKQQLREFGLLIGLGFPIFLGWLIPLFFGHQFRVWTLWIGVPGLILGLTAPRLLLVPYKLWMKLGLFLGWVNSHLILGFVFLFVLQPIAFFMRFTGYDPLGLRRCRDITYRQNTNNHKVDLTRIF